MINSFSREYQKSKDLLHEFQGNLLALPEVLSKVEIAQKRMGKSNCLRFINN